MEPVIVVGAGPTGLALALALSRHEVPVIVLDRGPCAPVADARSVLLHPEGTALLARLGCPDLPNEGASWPRWRLLRRRQELLNEVLATGDPGLPVPLAPQHPGAAEQSPAGRERDGDSSAYRSPPNDTLPAVLHLTQYRLHLGLLRAAHACPHVRLVADASVRAVHQHQESVRVHTTGADGDTWHTGSYLVGCDGARSTVRKLLRIRFPGRTATDRYVTAIIQAQLPFPGEARVHCDPPWRGDTEVRARPLPDGLWRLDWLLAPDAGRNPSSTTSPSAGPAPDELIDRLRTTLAGWCGAVPSYELRHSGQYHTHQRLARHFRDGRAFLAGDAAHLLGAVGTQSVQENLADVDNLSWKLALVLHGHADQRLLDSYETERRGSVGARLSAIDQVLPLLRPAGRWQAGRRAILSGSSRRQLPLLAQGPLGYGRLGAPPDYPDSPLSVPTARTLRRGAPTRPGSTDTRIGQLVSDVTVTTTQGPNGGRDRLHNRLGRDFLVLLVAPGTGVWASRHWLSAGLMPKLGTALRALPVPGELLVTDAYPGAAAHTVLLIRPDGRLVHSMAGCRPEELLAYAETARGGPAELAQRPRDTVGAR